MTIAKDCQKTTCQQKENQENQFQNEYTCTLLKFKTDFTTVIFVLYFGSAQVIQVTTLLVITIDEWMKSYLMKRLEKMLQIRFTGWKSFNFDSGLLYALKT